VLQIRGNFDQALNLARELTQHLRSRSSNSINPDRIEGQKTGAFEIIDVLGKAPTSCRYRSATRHITAYWRGFTQYHWSLETLQDTAQDVGFPGRWRGAIVRRIRYESETNADRDSASAIPGAGSSRSR